jgi:Fe-S-cluster containining protein
MEELSTIVNNTPHNDICTQTCGGDCCVIYPGDLLDSERIRGYITEDPKKKRRIVQELARRLSEAKDISLKEAAVHVSGILEQNYPSFHSGILTLNHELRTPQAPPRCPLYGRNEGCMVYEARPEKCREKVCDLLQKMMNLG